MTHFEIISHCPNAASLDALLDLCFGPGRLARTAERLREGNVAVAEYHFCAQDSDGSLMGSINFWPVCIGDAPALLLGPLAVHPAHQGLGLGEQLMQKGLGAVDKARFPFVLLVGDLPYYERAGFQIAPRAVRLPGPVDPSRLLVKGMVSDSPKADSPKADSPKADSPKADSPKDCATDCANLVGSVRPAPELC